MALPDVSNFLNLSAARWRMLGSILRDLGYVERHAALLAVGGQVFPPMCRPLRVWHVRQMDGAAAHMLRLFFLQEPVCARDITQALGEGLVQDLIGAGLLSAFPHGDVRSCLRLGAFEGVLFFSDELSCGGDAVMGAGALTPALIKAALPGTGPTRGSPARQTALEIGCGAAVNALCLARHIPRVVSTDINPRAVTLATVNAALNHIDNVEFRTGDLFEPVRGETFDLIISQPPFIPQPDGALPATYMYGGLRGDELPLRMFGEIAGYLNPRGRALAVVELPEFASDPVDARIRAAVSENAGVLMLRAEGPDLDAFSVGDAAYEHPDFGFEYEKTVTTRREHLARLGVEALACVLVVIEKLEQRPGWTATVELEDLGPDSSTVDTLVAGIDILSRGREALLHARLRLRPGTAFAATKQVVRVLFPPGSALKEVVLDPGAHRVLHVLDGSPSVLEAARRFARESACRPSDVAETVLKTAELFLRTGVVVVT